MTSNPMAVLSLVLALGAWSLVKAESSGHNHSAQDKAHASAAGSHDGKTQDAHKAVCPVSGKPINPNTSLDTDTGKIVFCCKGCVKDYKAEPAKYADAVFRQQEILGPPRVQVICPVDGKPVNKSVSLKHDGHTILFSSDECRNAFKKTPAKYMPKFYGAFTTQTLCPIVGEPIDPTKFLELEAGERIYFCGMCDECPDKFAADPTFHGQSLPSFYLCPMAKQDGDLGSLTPSDCPKCGMHRQQISKVAKAGSPAKTHDKETGKQYGHAH